MMLNDSIKVNLMYGNLQNLIIGFHGCHKEVYDKVIHNNEMLLSSTNSYDWLGNGIYFWEQNYDRAVEWACEHHGENGKVLGAIISLDYCLNLLDRKYIQLLADEYQYMEEDFIDAGLKTPKNCGKDKTGNPMLRNLDCAVIEYLHRMRKENNQKPFDSVRGVFWEGKEIYPNSGFREQNHIQVCVRNPNCIKGFFVPREYKEF